MTDQTPALTATPSVRDAHGFNPDDFEWIPVARQRRSDGWTPQRQREFIEVLADTGSVVEAARAANMSDGPGGSGKSDLQQPRRLIPDRESLALV